MVERWELPSGKSWDDLYDYILSRADDINPKELMFTGFIAFVWFSKYNEEGNNWLNVLAANDDDNCQFGKWGQEESRKRFKTEKDGIRDLETGTVSLFVARGLSLDTLMKIIEVAQFEDSKIREDIRDRLLPLDSWMNQILRERSQQIDLSKIMYPVYDKNNSNWEMVVALTADM